MLLTALALTLSCGGGGTESTSGNSAPESLATATIDAQNSARAAGLAISASQLLDLGENFTPQFSTPKNQIFPKMGQRVLNLIKSMPITRADAMPRGGSTHGSASYQCENDGGNALVDGSWIGPDATRDACREVSNFAAAMTFSECDQGTSAINGGVTLQTTGGYCAPTSMTMHFSNLTLSDTSLDIFASMNDFQINYSGMSWSNGLPTQMTVTLNGDVAATVSNRPAEANFKNFTAVINRTGTQSQIAISGALINSCLDGWITFDTISELVINDNTNCPVAGSLRIRGADNATATVTYNSDGSVDIENHHYESCAQLDPSC